MPRASLRRGRVVDEYGDPVQGALVSVEWSTCAVPEITLVSGPDGGFRLGLPEGRFRIGARWGERRGSSEVAGGPADAPIVVRLGTEARKS